MFSVRSVYHYVLTGVGASVHLTTAYGAIGQSYVTSNSSPPTHTKTHTQRHTHILKRIRLGTLLGPGPPHPIAQPCPLLTGAPPPPSPDLFKVVNAHKWSLRRLCFHRWLSVNRGILVSVGGLCQGVCPEGGSLLLYNTWVLTCQTITP